MTTEDDGIDRQRKMMVVEKEKVGVNDTVRV